MAAPGLGLPFAARRLRDRAAVGAMSMKQPARLAPTAEQAVPAVQLAFTRAEPHVRSFALRAICGVLHGTYVTAPT